MRSAHRRGFTLVEIIVVMAIISILMGLLVPTLAVMRSMANKSATRALLKKVDTGLRLFKTDWDVYPGQMSYPDLSGGAVFTNRLYYHIGKDLDATQRQAILTDAANAAAQYVYVGNGGASGTEGTQPSSLTYTYSLIPIGSEPRSNWGTGYRMKYAALANRMARQQVRLAAVAGNLWLRGPVVTTGPSTIVTSKVATPVFATPRASDTGPGPGWACDYLAGDIEKRYVDGNQIIDPWKRPLIYISQLVPAISGSGANIWQDSIYMRECRRYGLGAIGFDPSTGPGPTLATTRPFLLYGGRVVLSREDAGDGTPTPVDATYFPALNNLRRSDMRYYAPRGFARDFELWSSGPNRKFGYMRDAEVNADNISVVPYEKGL